MRTAFLVVALAVYAGCSRPSAEPQVRPDADLYVHAEGGLRMRAEPRTDSPVIFNIPDGEKLKVLADASDEVTIDGRKGRFRKVEHRGKTGWAFDAFFSTEAPPVPAVCSTFENSRAAGACSGLVMKGGVLQAGGRQFDIEGIVRHNRQGCVLKAAERNESHSPHEITIKPSKEGFSVRIAKAGRPQIECTVTVKPESKS